MVLIWHCQEFYRGFNYIPGDKKRVPCYETTSSSTAISGAQLNLTGYIAHPIPLLIKRLPFAVFISPLEYLLFLTGSTGGP